MVRDECIETVEVEIEDESSDDDDDVAKVPVPVESSGSKGSKLRRVQKVRRRL